MAGSAPTNSEAVDFEKQQAAEADAKEAQRQARLTQGQQLIDQIFNGQPVMASTPFDWSKLNPTTNTQEQQYEAAGGDLSQPHADLYSDPSLPAGYKIQKGSGGGGGGGSAGGAFAGFPTAGGGRAGGAPTVASELAGFAPATSSGGRVTSGPFAGFPTSGAGGGGAGAGGWQVVGPDGKVYNQGDSFDVQTPTGKTTGGFDDAFYQSYGEKVLDYYQPDEQRQYESAQRDLKYNLARAGTLQSSTAADKQGELAYNDALQKANIVANANTQVGNLKNQIQSNKESLINQLYATEDPTLTANLAESSAQASRLQDPNLTPAAALFTPALTAVGGVAQGYTNPYSLYGGGNQPSAIPPVASASSSSGKLSGGGPVYR